MMPPRHGFEPGLFHWFDWIFPLLLLLLVVGVAVAFFYTFRRPQPRATNGDPLRRAAGRYATGEIERVEFERIQRDLAGPRDDPIATAALRLARGEITIDEFDRLRERLSGSQGETAAAAEETPS